MPEMLTVGVGRFVQVGEDISGTSLVMLELLVNSTAAGEIN